jgi:hypothetical protein
LSRRFPKETSWKDKAKLKDDLELDQGAIQLLFYASEDGSRAGRVRVDVGRAGTMPSCRFPSDKVESEIQAPVVLQQHEEAVLLPAMAALGSDGADFVLVGKTRAGLLPSSSTRYLIHKRSQFGFKFLASVVILA